MKKQYETIILRASYSEENKNLIQLINPPLQQLKIIFRQWIRFTKKDISLIGIHLKPVRGILNPITHQKLTTILSIIFNTLLGLAKRQAIVTKQHFGVYCSDGIHLHRQKVTNNMFVRVVTPQVKSQTRRLKKEENEQNPYPEIAHSVMNLSQIWAAQIVKLV